MFFRGYVETKDKQCVEKFKGRTDFKTYEQVKSLPEFAGILAEDTILVDLDDGESSDVLFKVVQDYSLNCRVYRTTRGTFCSKIAAWAVVRPIAPLQSA